jgi:hypothetical protein
VGSRGLPHTVARVVTKAALHLRSSLADLNLHPASKSLRNSLFRAPKLIQSPARESASGPRFAMGKFSPTKQHGVCEEIANTSTAYGRRRRNWIDAHGTVPAGQVVDASCGNKNCIALQHSYLRPRVEQPGKYPKIAKRVHRLRIGQHFDIQGVGTDERSRNRFRSGLYAAARLDRVSVRGLPDGSVRITKVGEWSSVGA